MADTGVVIVTFNSSAVIGGCLDSCLAAGLTGIVVVDNASADDTCALVRTYGEVTLLANPENRGFAAAVNQGVAVSRGSTVLVLNPDTRLLTGVAPLEEAAMEYGAACGLLVELSGTPQRGFTYRCLPSPATLAFEVLGINRLWPGNPINRHYRCLDDAPDEERNVEQPAGAFLAVRRDVWQALDGMDERFHPVWFEDVDFCRRLADFRYRVRFVPSVKAAHHGGHSVRHIPDQYRQVYWYASLLTYAAKHFNWVTSRLLGLLVLVATLPRTLFGIPGVGWPASLAVGAAVARVAGRFMVRGGSPFATRAVSWESAPRFMRQSSSSRS